MEVHSMSAWKSFAPVVLSAALALSMAACKKKPPAPPPPAPPPAEAAPPEPEPPRITEFSAEPAMIERGQSSFLRWSVDNANIVSIEPGIGTVESTGSRQVFPSETTTYTLRASGPGGETSGSTTVTVTAPPPPAPSPAPARVSLSERLASEVRDAYFDFDRFNIREDARVTLTQNGQALRAIFQDFETGTVVIEGHCDERGSAEYNLGLGDRRVRSAFDFLVQLGVPANRLRTVSYGEERPQCTESNEACWQQNRRVHFSAVE
jgi:peptidoglycan-associated lipoprotein